MLLSVLMCVCNGEAWLKDAVDSVISQSYNDFEFIIVENGSTDRSWEVLQSYQDDRIRLFQTSIRQLPYNLNFGLEQCRGKWVARMDSDDICFPDRFERQLAYVKENPDVRVLGGQTLIFNENGKQASYVVPCDNNSIRRYMPFKSVLLHPTVMYHRETILAHSGYMGGQSEDFELWLRLSRSKDLQFANLSEPVLHYRVHGSQSRYKMICYAESCGLLFREFMISKNPVYLAGAFMFMAKGFLRGQA